MRAFLAAACRYKAERHTRYLLCRLQLLPEVPQPLRVHAVLWDSRYPRLLLMHVDCLPKGQLSVEHQRQVQRRQEPEDTWLEGVRRGLSHTHRVPASSMRLGGAANAAVCCALSFGPLDRPSAAVQEPSAAALVIFVDFDGLGALLVSL